MKGSGNIEGKVFPEHIRLFLSIPPKMGISGFMGYQEGKSGLMIFQRFGDMNFAYRNREIWREGYCADTVGKTQRRYKKMH